MRIDSLAMMATACLALALASQAQARDTIQIAGSSTVLPFATVVAEQFGQAYRQFKTPIVESGGTTGGFTQFCSGVGDTTIDIANASRPIRAAEMAACRSNGVTDIVEVKIGYDGIVFASRAGAARFALTPRLLYLALAEKVPVNGQLVANPYTNWSQIDPSLPNQEIQLFIPGENHGTREVFEEKVLLDGCKEFPEIQAIPADNNQRRNACRATRKDGRSVDIAGDYTETLARIESTPVAVGVFGLSFYDQNRDKVQVATIDGVTPSVETIASGQYPVRYRARCSSTSRRRISA